MITNNLRHTLIEVNAASGGGRSSKGKASKDERVLDDRTMSMF
jgi:hypothetical protein